MKEIKFKLDKELILAAYGHEVLREDCKKFLQKNKQDYDKFTAVTHDSFIGYITEIAFKYFLIDNYSEILKEVRSWEDNFNISRIKKILQSNTGIKEEDISYVKEYFYDKYDLELISEKERLLIDVKTALTQKEPNQSWSFMYPVVQAHKEGKDYMVLTYYVTNSKNIEDLCKIVLVGYISEKDIRKCRIIKQGEITRFGTKSQIDNYETELSIHYKDIDILISLLK